MALRKSASQTSLADHNPAVLYQRVNEAKFAWFHVKALLISGVGFFTDAYDLFVIGLVKPMLAVIYFPALNGKLPLSDDLWVTGTALAGTLLGQIFFGVCGDYLGRKKVYLLTLLLMIFATVAQALSATVVKGVGIITVICFWRFVLGFGIGGDYPLSATITSEYSNTQWRGAFLAAVFASQGIGIISAAIVSMVVVKCFQDLIVNHSILYLDYVWRIIIGLGAVPAVATIYLRSKLPETPKYVADVEKDVPLAQQNMDTAMGTKDPDFVNASLQRPMEKDRISYKALYRYLTEPGILRNRNIWVLFGTCSCWFLLDIAFYSQNLFLPNVLTAIGYSPKIKLPSPTGLTMIDASGMNVTVGEVFLYDTPRCMGACSAAVYNKMWKTAAGNAIVAMMGTVPGYFFTVAFVDVVGRIPIQFFGFGMMTALLIILAAAYDSINSVSKWLFIVLYSLTFFFANFGPNATTFIVPVELFTTKYRSTLHGISAASGKAGAIVGAFGIGKLFLEQSITLQTCLAVLASTNFVGFLCTIFVPETKRMTLEDASLHSTSIFGKFMAMRGRPQVNPAVAQHFEVTDAMQPSSIPELEEVGLSTPTKPRIISLQHDDHLASFKSLKRQPSI